MSTHYEGTAAEIAALDAYIKLARAAESVSLRINDHLRDYNLTISQFGVLEALFHLGPMQVGELGSKILKSSGNMTLVIDNLEKNGLVTRARREDDRRRIDVHLTDKGQALVSGVLPRHVDGVVAAFAALEPEQLATLATLCRQLGLSQAPDK